MIPTSNPSDLENSVRYTNRDGKSGMRHRGDLLEIFTYLVIVSKVSEGDPPFYEV